jgi:hypothetical protein
VPFGKQDEIPTLTRLTSDDPDVVKIKLMFKDGTTDLIAVASAVRELSIGTHKGTGVALCVRSKGGKTTVDLIQPTPLPGKKKKEK